MNSVEKIMKVNQLAQDLLKRGIVTSRDEAVRKAEEMLNTTISPVNPAPRQEPQQPAQATAENTTQPGGANVNQDQVQQMYEYVKKQFAVFSENIKTLNTQLSEMKKEIDGLKDQIARQQRAIASSEQRPQQQAQTQQPEQPARPQSGHPSKESSSGHHRTGSSTSQDVAIEKMFYYGNK